MRAQAEVSVGKKARGAFFTPHPIAEFLARWATKEVGPETRVLDPTCGEAVFLLAAAARMRDLGADPVTIGHRLSGVDVDGPSLAESRALLAAAGVAEPNLIERDFFALPTPAQVDSQLDWQDAVIGNPPFVRYQTFTGDTRKRGLAAALAQGVRLSRLTSSWAPTLVHASAFLKPTGRLAMVLPAELLTVHYAEPVRRWLRQRFAVVNLVMFEHLQFHGAEEQVVLLVAHGQGPCDSFCLIHVDDATELADVHPLDPVGTSPAAEGKWSDLVLSVETRQLFKRVKEQMTELDSYGTISLGTVTGANEYFAMTEGTRRRYGIEERHLKRLSPPGTRHLRGFDFTPEQWRDLRAAGERVWLLNPSVATQAKGVLRYVRRGEREKIHKAYKCTVREPWWCPPAVPPPDLFFTYMSHRFPRLVTNSAKATALNSMHCLHADENMRSDAREALPLLMLNSATLLGAEVLGRAYGGGILKMEPREASGLPVPRLADLRTAWARLHARRSELEMRFDQGEWEAVVEAVDEILLGGAMGMSEGEIGALRNAAALLRSRRMRKRKN